jgi:hypothetical protein
MSSAEVAVSPTKKKTKQQNMDQIVSSENVMNNDDEIDECNNNDDDNDETRNQQTLINNLNDTNNKECHVDDACMEPLLIQDCVNCEECVTNPINNETSSENSSSSDIPFNDSSPNEDGGGGGDEIKPNLTLNLASDKTPKNKKFLDSSEDQIMNQIFFQTISVTPTADDDILGSSKFLSSETSPLTPVERLQPVDFFNRKIDEDETFDTTYTDTADNYQEENDDANLCSLSDNFNENYCSFSSIDYNPTNVCNNNNNKNDEGESDLLQPDTFLGEYAEQMRKQRPSIVIDCYDDSDNSKGTDNEEGGGKATVVVLGNEKINDYCFYFDQTIEEDDDDACYVNGSDAGEAISERVGGHEDESSSAVNLENGKTLDHDVVMMMQGEEDDECFETEEDDYYGNEEATNDSDAPDDKSVSDDEGVINESVNVSGLGF